MTTLLLLKVPSYRHSTLSCNKQDGCLFHRVAHTCAKHLGYPVLNAMVDCVAHSPCRLSVDQKGNNHSSPLRGPIKEETRNVIINIVIPSSPNTNSPVQGDGQSAI